MPSACPSAAHLQAALGRRVDVARRKVARAQLDRAGAGGGGGIQPVGGRRRRGGGERSGAARGVRGCGRRGRRDCPEERENPWVGSRAGVLTPLASDQYSAVSVRRAFNSARSTSRAAHRKAPPAAGSPGLRTHSWLPARAAGQARSVCNTMQCVSSAVRDAKLSERHGFSSPTRRALGEPQRMSRRGAHPCSMPSQLNSSWTYSSCSQNISYSHPG